MYVIGYPLLALFNILNSVLWLYTLIILAAVIISWFPMPPFHPVVRILNTLTEPAFNVVRRRLPIMGGLDLSPIIVILLLQFISQGILPVLFRFAQGFIQ